MHLKSHGRFALTIDGREVAVVDYRRLPGKWNIVHTYTEPAARGYGVASDLIREVLNAARAEGVTVIPTCPYVAWWIGEHRDYEDLVATDADRPDRWVAGPERVPDVRPGSG